MESVSSRFPPSAVGSMRMAGSDPLVHVFTIGGIRQVFDSRPTRLSVMKQRPHHALIPSLPPAGGGSPEPKFQ
jgi:hypothetical protein